MAIKKSELYSSIWKSCDELRGGMDASEYKDYVLIMLFIKYISDKYAGVNMEHNIGSGLFRFIPLTRKLKWRQFYTVKSLWGSLSDNNEALNYLTDINGNKISAFKKLNGKTFIEVGTGIDNIFKVFRIDFIWRLSPSTTYAGTQNKFGIFGSFQFQF